MAVLFVSDWFLNGLSKWERRHTEELDTDPMGVRHTAQQVAFKTTIM